MNLPNATDANDIPIIISVCVIIIIFVYNSLSHGFRKETIGQELESKNIDNQRMVYGDCWSITIKTSGHNYIKIEFSLTIASLN